MRRDVGRVIESRRSPGEGAGPPGPAPIAPKVAGAGRSLTRWLWVPMLTFLLAAGAAWLYFDEQTRRSQARLADMQRSALLDAVVRDALLALSGDGDARTRLEALRRRIGDASDREPQSREAWEALDAALARFMGAEADRDALSEALDRLRPTTSRILAASGDLVDALIAAEAPPPVIRAAIGQLALVARIAANTDRMFGDGIGVVAAADQVARDAIRFGDSLNAMLDGNPARGLERVEDGTARGILHDVSRAYRESAAALDRMLRGAVSLRDREVNLRSVADHVDRLRRATAAEADVQPRLPWLPAADWRIVLFLSVLPVLALLVASSSIAGRGRAIERIARAGDADAAACVEAERETAVARERDVERIHRSLARLGEDVRRFAAGDPLPAGREHDADLGPFAHAIRDAVGAMFHQVRAARTLARNLESRARALCESTAENRAAAQRHVEELDRATAAMQALGDGSAGIAAAARRGSAAVESIATAGPAAGPDARSAAAWTRTALEDAASSTGDAARELSRVAVRADALGELEEQLDELAEQCRVLALNLSLQTASGVSAPSGAARFADDADRLCEHAREAARGLGARREALAEATGAADTAVEAARAQARSAAGQGVAMEGRIDRLRGRIAEVDDALDALGACADRHSGAIESAGRLLAAARDVAVRAQSRGQLAADAADALSTLAGKLDAGLGRLGWTGAGGSPVVELDLAEWRSPPALDDPAEGAPHRFGPGREDG